ncbi:MAG: S9 family peptidase [Bacteroidetes bacterium]|nr:S9 family peptidase [Bacteroidota bacterium]
MFNKTKRLFVAITLVICSGSLKAQKPPITIKDFNSWKSIRNIETTYNGKYCGYTLRPNKGDNLLVYHNLESGSADTIKYVKSWFFAENKHLIYSINISEDSLHTLKLLKKKPDELPKDSLVVIDLETGVATGIGRVKNWQLPKNRNAILVYQQNEIAGFDTMPDSLKPSSAELKKLKGRPVVVLNLKTNEKHQINKVTDFELAANGKLLLYSAEGDSALESHIGVYNIDKNEQNTLKEGKHKLGKMAIDSAGTQVAVTASFAEKKDQAHYELLWWNAKKNETKLLLDSHGLEPKMRISEHFRLRFSHKGSTLQFGIAQQEKQWPKDSTILDEDKPKLDVWSHSDQRLQPEQKVDLKNDEKRSLLALYSFSQGKWQQLQFNYNESISLSNNGDGNYALVYDRQPYLKERTWEYPWVRDVYLFNLSTKKKELIQKKGFTSLSFSPNEKYLVGYDATDSNWHSFNLTRMKWTSLTKGLNVPFYDEDDDHPAQPYPHGNAGFTDDGENLIIYDKYDAWLLDPSAKNEPFRLTNGRNDEIRYRLTKLDWEQNFWPVNEKILVTALNKETKKEAFGYLIIGQGVVEMSQFQYQNVSYAHQSKNKRVLLANRESSTDPTNLYVVKPNFELQQISNANPQKTQYNWYTTELVSWVSADGIPLKGTLYLPENLDKSKQYPMITYFYEQLSDYYNNFPTPAPSRSTISKSFYASNGYIVFVPDIVYKDGLPGRSAFNCIMPGVLKLIENRDYINKNRLALQGQSWGGYQTAYLITQTDLFACSMAGAPVSNMTSAYGGIRWGSGINRAFQYERAQSRIGGTLWEMPQYYLENSPVFMADRVNTPLLIMHNDNDGAVPWYQGIEYFTALRRLNKPVWMLVYNGEEHNLLGYANRVDLSNRMFQFFNYYLKDQPMPSWMNGLPALEKGKTLGY